MPTSVTVWGLSGLNVTIAKISQKLLAGVCGLLLSTITFAAVENYGYPITDRFVATVVGTPV
jgi:hypothetical protein